MPILSAVFLFCLYATKDIEILVFFVKIKVTMIAH